MLISSLGAVKEPTHYSRRVGDQVPGVVAVFYEYMGGWVGIAGPHQLNSCQNFNLLKQINNRQVFRTVCNVSRELLSMPFGSLFHIRGKKE